MHTKRFTDPFLDDHCTKINVNTQCGSILVTGMPNLSHCVPASETGPNQGRETLCRFFELPPLGGGGDN